MRKIKDFIIKSLLSAITLISFFACTNNQKQIITSVQISNLKTDTICPLIDGQAEPVGKFSLEMSYPASCSEASKTDTLLSMFLYDCLGIESQNAREAAQAAMESFVANYKLMANDFKNEGEEWGASFNFEDKTSDSIRFNQDNFLSYSIFNYRFTGGAHGITNTSNNVIYLADMSRIYLRDIIDESNYDKVAMMIINAIAQERGVSDYHKLNDEGFFSIEEVQPTENFYINLDGMTWSYNPYDISAYVLGQINVSLSWDELSPYLNPDSPVLSMLKNR